MSEEKTATNEVVKKAAGQLAQGMSSDVTIYTAKGLDSKDPIKTDIKGNITSVSNYLDKRAGDIDQKACHLLVDREAGTVELVLNENDPFYHGSVKAALSRTDDLKGFKINSSENWSPEVLANHIKMNRTLFESKEEAMKLHSELKNFRAKVNQEIEKKDDGRANTRSLKDQVVNSNLPEEFNLHLRVFKGEEKMTFKVEVGIHPDTLDCQLNSPDLKDFIKQETDKLIDREITLIKVSAPDIAVIEK